MKRTNRRTRDGYKLFGGSKLAKKNTGESLSSRVVLEILAED